MPDIKTRETVKDIKVLDKAAVAGERMRNAFVRTKDRVSNLMDDEYDSPTEYAEEQIQSAAEDAISDVGHEVERVTSKTYDKAREVMKNRKDDRTSKSPDNSGNQSIGNKPEPYANEPKGELRSTNHTDTKSSPNPQNGQRSHSNAGRSARQSPAVKHSTSSSSQGSSRIKTRDHSPSSMTGKSGMSAQSPHRTIKTAQGMSRSTAKTAKGTVKNAKKGIKTAQRTSKTTVKTAEATAKATKTAAQAGAKAAKTAAHVAKVTAKALVEAAKAAGKAIVAAAKALAALIQEIAAAIAAGGWVAVVIIIVICLIGALVVYFGIFFSSEDTGSEKTMSVVVQEINEEYNGRLEEIKVSNPHDILEMSGSKAVWPDVLSVYAVNVMTDEENPQEVATLSAEKEQVLREIFWEMNDISHTVTAEEIPIIQETDDGEGNIIEEEVIETKTTLRIVVSHKSADEMVRELNFNKDQIALMDSLLAADKAELWMNVLYGVYGMDEQIVAVAISQVGNVGGYPYWSWYGFSSRVEWCACFVSWCANECGYIENGIIPKFAGCSHGIDWFKARAQWADSNIEPVPGMLIFFDWNDPVQDGVADHVGIVHKVENGRVYTIEGNSGDRCVSTSYPVGWFEIYGYGVPAY